MLDHSKCNKHPHIVGVEGLIVAEDYICFVMEYIDSGSLATLLDRQSSIPEDEAKMLLYQILLGLQHCHSQAVYHRLASKTPYNFFMLQPNFVNLM